VAAFWDSAADSFDDQVDHGLRDPVVRSAWRARLESWLPPPPVEVLDLGCGTGSLSLLLASGGYRVTAVDLSPRMVELARRKLAGHDVRVLVGDAADLPALQVDVVLVRHLVWTLPEPVAALHHWISRSRPGGRLVLVEGHWGASDGAYGWSALPWSGGVTADDLAAALRPLVSDLRVEPLTDPVLWGRAVTDERYCIVATI
jgi:SAM-dependent methyltransferase